MTDVVASLYAAVAFVEESSDHAPLVIFDLEQAKALLGVVEDRCQDHGACEECETPLCVTCQVGELSGCDHYSLCASCWIAFCLTCRREYAANHGVVA